MAKNIVPYTDKASIFIIILVIIIIFTKALTMVIVKKR